MLSVLREAVHMSCVRLIDALKQIGNTMPPVGNFIILLLQKSYPCHCFSPFLVNYTINYMDYVIAVKGCTCRLNAFYLIIRTEYENHF